MAVTTAGDRRYRLDEMPRQIRVHGVGGPQATRMLGLLHGEDTVPVPPDLATGPSPTRFVRGVPDDGIEAYEWGALTTGSWAKGLWVLYLPFTLINAAGWAHPARPSEPGSPRSALVYRAATHVVTVLATITYVVWMAYILLDLIATRWVEHAVTSREVSGIGRDAVGVWVPIAMPFLFLGLVGAVFGAPVLRNSRPTRIAGRPRVGPAEGLDDPDFFAQGEGPLRVVHTVAVVVVALGALALHLADWDRLGLLVILTGVAQTGALLVMGIADLVGRARWRWYEVVDTATLPPGLWEPRRALPVGVALAAVGTALAHSAFSGAARLLREVLARWPEPSDLAAIEAHAELGAADLLGAMLVLAVVGLLFTLGHVFDTPIEERGPWLVALARRAHLLGTWLLAAVAIPVAVYAVANQRAYWPDPSWTTLTDWYDGYTPDRPSILTTVGSAIVSALPVAVFAILRRSHRTGLGRVIGNVWDVLTFWPRRYHPFAVPAASERAVPELRTRIDQAVQGRTAADPLVVAAHSQGSVLAAAALAGMEDLCGRVRLVTFGSPLGTLYAPTWPAYVPAALVSVRDALGPEEAGDALWINFARPTDPIGAGVPLAVNVVLPDPRPPTTADLDEDQTGRRPIERTRWGVVEGHSRYLSDPEVRQALSHGRPAPASPTPCRPAPAAPDDDGGPLRWAHRGGAAERPGNTIAAMHHAMGPAGATALELDVQLARGTGPGPERLVVVHDRVLERSGDGHGRVRCHSVAALGQVVPGRPEGSDDLADRLPSLADLLDAVPDVPLTIEIKGRQGKVAAAAVAAVLADRFGDAAGPGRVGPVVVTSFRGRTVTHARRALRAAGLPPDVAVVAPGAAVTLWFLFGAALPWNPPVRAGYARLQVPDLWVAGVPLVSARLLRKAHARGWGVDVWTVDEPAPMARLLALMHAAGAGRAEGAPPIRDGIMTDHPTRLAGLARPAGRDVPPTPGDEA